MTPDYKGMSIDQLTKEIRRLCDEVYEEIEEAKLEIEAAQLKQVQRNLLAAKTFCDYSKYDLARFIKQRRQETAEAFPNDEPNF